MRCAEPSHRGLHAVPSHHIADCTLLLRPSSPVECNVNTIRHSAHYFHSQGPPVSSTRVLIAAFGQDAVCFLQPVSPGCGPPSPPIDRAEGRHPCLDQQEQEPPSLAVPQGRVFPSADTDSSISTTRPSCWQNDRPTHLARYANGIK